MKHWLLAMPPKQSNLRALFAGKREVVEPPAKRPVGRPKKAPGPEVGLEVDEELAAQLRALKKQRILRKIKDSEK